MLAPAQAVAAKVAGRRSMGTPCEHATKCRATAAGCCGRRHIRRCTLPRTWWMQVAPTWSPAGSTAASSWRTSAAQPRSAPRSRPGSPWAWQPRWASAPPVAPAARPAVAAPCSAACRRRSAGALSPRRRLLPSVQPSRLPPSVLPVPQCGARWKPRPGCLCALPCSVAAGLTARRPCWPLLQAPGPAALLPRPQAPSRRRPRQPAEPSRLQPPHRPLHPRHRLLLPALPVCPAPAPMQARPSALHPQAGPPAAPAPQPAPAPPACASALSPAAWPAAQAWRCASST